jgi:prepilin-type N-terminal cleavage/methylation domain-containing protein
MRRNGFTLIEMLVALTIGAIVVLMVHDSFAGTTDLTVRLDSDRRTQVERVAMRAFLTRAFGSLEIGTPHTHGFEGLPDRVAFSSALDGAQPAGLLIRASNGRLVAEGSSPSPTQLNDVAVLSCEYLLSYGSESTWVQEWHSPASAPLAARLRLMHADGGVDTLLFIIGPRG